MHKSVKNLIVAFTGKNKVKICYIISTLASGSGGHYYSLRATADMMAETESVDIINFGPTLSPTLRNFPTVKFISFNGYNILAVLVGIIKSACVEKYDVIHAFDTRAYAFARIAANVTKTPLILTKCGGRNSNDFPRCDNLILYSRENLKYFKNDKSFKKTKTWLIPNRVYSINKDIEASRRLRGKVNEQYLFVRIGRIGVSYEESFRQAIDLIRNLSNDGASVALAIIGHTENEHVLMRLKKRAGRHVYFFTEDEWTHNASRLLPAADFVIGTGRGLMEAASHSKILLTPLSNGKLPVLVDENNAENLSATNFSPRNYIEDFDEAASYKKIQQFLCDENARRMYEEFVKGLYRDCFDMRSVRKTYLNIYQGLNASRTFSFRRGWDLMKNLYTVNRMYAHVNRTMT